MTECPQGHDAIVEAPEAGYWYCPDCGHRGAGPKDDIDWWWEDVDA